jgi:hypothetical protein
MKNGNHARGADSLKRGLSLEYGHLFPIGSGTGKKLQELQNKNGNYAAGAVF